MDPSSRDEMLQLIRDLGAQLAWQRDAGLLDVPAAGTMPTDLIAAAGPPTGAPAPPPPESVAPVPTPVIAPGVAVAEDPVPIMVPEVIAPPQVTVSAPLLATVEASAVDDRVGALRVIQDEVRACRSCKLAPTRTQTVFARGNPGARLCFIGEGPGADEDRTGQPFVGAAGQLLDRIIAAMRLTQDQVYIANIVKCRPPNNRVPDHEEMSACTPFLLRQLDVVRPDVIVALGRTATAFLLESKGSMTPIRGRWHSWRGVPVMPTWHPSYVLRVRDDPKSTARAEVWTDMKLVLERLGLPVPAARG